jgi:hypothetical protein
MKKLTLLKLAIVVAAAWSLYGQATTTPSFTCPAICPHLTCGNGEHAFCSGGKCVCP